MVGSVRKVLSVFHCDSCHCYLFHLGTDCLHFLKVICIHSGYKHVGVAGQGGGFIPFLPVCADRTLAWCM